MHDQSIESMEVSLIGMCIGYCFFTGVGHVWNTGMLTSTHTYNACS